MPAPLIRGTHSSHGHLVTNSTVGSSGLMARVLKKTTPLCQSLCRNNFVMVFFHIIFVLSINGYVLTWRWGRSALRGRWICICVSVGPPVCRPSGGTRRIVSPQDKRCTHNPPGTDTPFHHCQPGTREQFKKLHQQWNYVVHPPFNDSKKPFVACLLKCSMKTLNWVHNISILWYYGEITSFYNRLKDWCDILGNIIILMSLS